MCIENVRRSVAARSYGGGRNEQADHRILRAVETTLYNIIMMETCRYTLVQTHRLNCTETEL